MAIALLSYPENPVSPYTPVLFRVTTDSTDITTKIQLKVYYRRNEDDFYTLCSTTLQDKAIGKQYFEFNVGSILKELLTSDYATGSTGLNTIAQNSAIEYAVYFTEYYPSSLFVAHDTLGVYLGYYTSNIDIYTTETQSIAAGSSWYLNAASTTNKFLTDSPSSVPIRASERIQLDFLTSYTDPIIKVRETKNNLSTATVSYEIPDNTFNYYIWNWAVDVNETVTILPRISGNEGFIASLSSGSSYKYMADTGGTMWGGVNLIANNDILEFYLPVLSAATASINIRHAAKLGIIFNWEIYYYYSGSWHASLINPSNTSTLNVFATLTEVMPAGATAMRIKKITGGVDQLWLPYIYVSYVSDNVVNKRCQFTLDTTHIDSDTKKLEIWAESTISSNVIISEVKTFLVDTNNYYGTTVRFAAKNKRGGFDHFTYTEGYSEVLTAEKVIINKELPNSFTTKDFSRSTTNVVSEKIHTCYSKYIEESNLQWWATIIESEEVYVVISDVLYSVDILTSSVVSYTHTDLVQLKIDWTYSFKR